MNMRNEEFCCSKKGHYTAFCYLSYPSYTWTLSWRGWLSCSKFRFVMKK